MMRMTFGTAAVISAIVLMTSAFWPDGHPGPSPRRIVAQDEPKVAASQVPLFSPTLGDADMRAEASLQKRLDVDYLEQSFKDVLDDLGFQSNLQFYIKVRYLEDLGISTDEPVTLSLKDVSVEMALGLILENLELTYVIRDGVVLITTKDDFDSVAEVRVYNCRDLLEAYVGDASGGKDPESVETFNPGIEPSPPVEKKTNRGNKKKKSEDKVSSAMRSRRASVTRDVLAQFGGGMGGGGGGMAVPKGPPTREEQLMNIITIAVMPESWEDVGGPGTIGEFDGMIVIRHNPRAHRQVEQVLHMLRDASSQQDWEGPGGGGFGTGGGGGFF